MHDIALICARCGGEVHDVAHNRDGALGGVGYRHDRRVEPWDHDLELSVGEPAESTEECDFCGEPEPSWLYRPTFDADAEDLFEVELDATGLSDDDAAGAVLNVLYSWRACDTCSVLIADRNLERLIAAALERTPVPDRAGIDEDAVRARLNGAFSVFFSTRPGRPLPSHAL